MLSVKSATNLKVLNFLDKLNILLRQALLVRGDVHNGAVQLLDLNVQLADIDVQPLDGLLDGDLLLVGVLQLGQELVDLSLELRFLLLSPGDKNILLSPSTKTTMVRMTMI